MASGAEIVFGSLPLLTSTAAQHDYQFEVCADGTDYGNPEAVITDVGSMLMDGTKAEITRFGDHVVTLKVRIGGTSLNAVAAGQAVLMAEVNRSRNTLSWKPPGWATASIFDVVYSVLKFDHDDLSETRAERYFTLSLTCVPGARRDTLTTLVAEPIPGVAPTVTTIDDCTSLTGWSSDPGSLALDGGAVKCYGSTSVVARRSGLSVAVADSDFVVIDVEGVETLYAWTLQTPEGDSISADIVATSTVSAGRKLWLISPSAAMTLGAVAIGVAPYNVDDGIHIHEVYKTDQLPFVGTSRQRSFLAQVKGTIRTSADLIVETEDDGGLGNNALIHSSAVGTAMDPPLRQWLESSITVEEDDTLISGAWNDFSEGTLFHIPASEIPAGTHLLVARLKRTAPADVELAWLARMPSLAYWNDDASISGATTLPLTTAWTTYPLTTLTLPLVEVDPGSSVVVELALTADGADSEVEIDEAWLFNLDTGVLTWLTDLNLAGAEPSKIEVRSATVDRDRPTWTVGTAGTDIDTISVAERAVSPGVHEFQPGMMRIFVATENAKEQTVSVEHYERHQHHVPPQDS